MKKKWIQLGMASAVTFFMAACHEPATVNTTNLPNVSAGQNNQQDEVARLREQLGSLQTTLDRTQEQNGAVQPPTGSEAPAGGPAEPGTGDVSGETPPEQPQEQPAGPAVLAQPNPGAVSIAHARCSPDKGLINNPVNDGFCICDSAHHLPPVGYEQRDGNNPRCILDVAGLKLGIQVGSGSNDGTNGTGNVIFFACRTPPPPGLANRTNDNNCTPISIDVPRDLYSTAGSVKKVEYLARDHPMFFSGRVFPDDFQYFYLESDGDLIPLTDAVRITGISLEVKFQGANQYYKYYYQNGCYSRRIERESGHNWYAAFSLAHDDAWCFFLTTPGTNDSGTDSEVYARFHFSGTLPADSLPGHTGSEREIRIFSQDPHAIYFFLDHDSYDDFGHNANGGFGARADSLYGMTFFNSRPKIANEFQIGINGNDAWKPSLIRAVHFNPGDRAFLDQHQCMADDSTPNVWFSGDASDGEYGQPALARWPSPNTFHGLHSLHCTIFEEDFADFTHEETVNNYLQFLLHGNDLVIPSH